MNAVSDYHILRANTNVIFSSSSNSSSNSNSSNSSNSNADTTVPILTHHNINDIIARSIKGTSITGDDDVDEADKFKMQIERFSRDDPLPNLCVHCNSNSSKAQYRCEANSCHALYHLPCAIEAIHELKQRHKELMNKHIMCPKCVELNLELNSFKNEMIPRSKTKESYLRHDVGDVTRPFEMSLELTTSRHIDERSKHMIRRILQGEEDSTMTYAEQIKAIDKYMQRQL